MPLEAVLADLGYSGHRVAQLATRSSNALAILCTACHNFMRTHPNGFRCKMEPGAEHSTFFVRNRIGGMSHGFYPLFFMCAELLKQKRKAGAGHAGRCSWNSTYRHLRPTCHLCSL